MMTCGWTLIIKRARRVTAPVLVSRGRERCLSQEARRDHRASVFVCGAEGDAGVGAFGRILRELIVSEIGVCDLADRLVDIKHVYGERSGSAVMRVAGLNDDGVGGVLLVVQQAAVGDSDRHLWGIVKRPPASSTSV